MNYYKVLQVKSTASSKEIKQAYRRLVKEFHPDSQHQNANNDVIIKLNAAYEILSDPEDRRRYDATLNDTLEYRQNKSNNASQHYRQNRKQYQHEDISQAVWLEQVYAPINNLIDSIIEPLEGEIEELSADIFDDELMEIFVDYLENSRSTCQKAQSILSSLPNPSLYAGIAAYIYYGLNHINDGIDELHRFTQTYEECYLYTGRELFNLAEETTFMASQMVQRFS